MISLIIGIETIIILAFIIAFFTWIFLFIKGKNPNVKKFKLKKKTIFKIVWIILISLVAIGTILFLIAPVL